MPRPSGGARNRSLPPQKRENSGIPANLSASLSANHPASLPASPDIGHPTSHPVSNPTSLEQLKAQIRQLEGFGGTLTGTNQQVLPFGIDAIDDHLPGGGLARGALHEIFAADAGIATAFCALLAGRLANDTENHAILWCERPWTLDAGALYGPALLQFGIDPARMILVRPRRDTDALWAMEEGLRCGRIAAVVGEITDMSLTASRRLQLAAEETGVTALMLRPKTDRPTPSAAVTRWRLDAVEHETGNTSTGQADGQANDQPDKLANDNQQTRPAPPGLTFNGPPGLGFNGPPGLGAARWRAELFRCRGGVAANWMMEWNDETGNFSLAAEICDRPPVPSAARLAG
jgi:protein ImuA